MAKSSYKISLHLCGDKGNILSSQLRSKNLENVMVVPIEIGKSYHKALVANYFGCLLRESFEFHNSREGIGFLHNTITEISKHQPVEEVLIGMEATGHYFKNPAASLAQMGYRNLFILNPWPLYSRCTRGEDGLTGKAAHCFYWRWGFSDDCPGDRNHDTP